MNKTAKFGTQNNSRNEQQQEMDPIKKRFELYDSLFSKFEEKISKLECAAKKKPSQSQTIQNKQNLQCNTEENSQINSNLSVNVLQNFKKFEDKMLDLKIQVEKKHLSQEEKFKAIIKRLEKYESVQEKLDQEIKQVELNSNTLIQNINVLDERLNKIESNIKAQKITGQLGYDSLGNSDKLNLNLTEEFSKEINSLYNVVKKCNQNYNNLFTQISQIKKQIPQEQRGSTPTQNKKQSRIIGREDIEKPLLTFQDTNRKFYIDYGSSKKLGERLLDKEEKQENHLLSYHNSPNFITSDTSPINKKQSIQQTQNIDQKTNLPLQQQTTTNQNQLQKQNPIQQINQSFQRIFGQGNKEQLNNSNITSSNNTKQQIQQLIDNKKQTSTLNKSTLNSQLNNSTYISSIKNNLNEEFEFKRTGRSNSMHENGFQANMLKNIDVEPLQYVKPSIKYDYYFENNSTKSNRYSSTNFSSNQALNTIISQNDISSPNLTYKRQSLKPPISTISSSNTNRHNFGSQINLSLNSDQIIPINISPMNITSSFTPSSNIDNINRSYAIIEEKKRKIDEEIEKRIREESLKREKIIGTIEAKNKVYEEPNMSMMQEINKFKHTPKGTQQSRSKEMMNRLSLERKVKDDKILQFEKQAISQKNQ